MAPTPRRPTSDQRLLAVPVRRRGPRSENEGRLARLGILAQRLAPPLSLSPVTSRITIVRRSERPTRWRGHRSRAVRGSARPRMAPASRRPFDQGRPVLLRLKNRYPRRGQVAARRFSRRDVLRLSKNHALGPAGPREPGHQARSAARHPPPAGSVRSSQGEGLERVPHPQNGGRLVPFAVHPVGRPAPEVVVRPCRADRSCTRL